MRDGSPKKRERMFRRKERRKESQRDNTQTRAGGGERQAQASGKRSGTGAVATLAGCATAAAAAAAGTVPGTKPAESIDCGGVCSVSGRAPARATISAPSAERQPERESRCDPLQLRSRHN